MAKKSATQRHSEALQALWMTPMTEALEELAPRRFWRWKKEALKGNPHAMFLAAACVALRIIKDQQLDSQIVLEKAGVNGISAAWRVLVSTADKDRNHPHKVLRDRCNGRIKEYLEQGHAQGCKKCSFILGTILLERFPDDEDRGFELINQLVAEGSDRAKQYLEVEYPEHLEHVASHRDQLAHRINNDPSLASLGYRPDECPCRNCEAKRQKAA